jgi:hypothetical protein
MLAAAASSVADPRVTWVHARAETVPQHLTGPVDAAVCNSAIWQTDLAETAAGVRAVIRPGGPFAFNVPADFLADGPDRDWRVADHALVSEMRAIAERDYGWAPDTAAPRRRLTRESIRRFLAGAGFEVEQIAESTHEETAESQLAWLRLPIFSKDRLRGVPYADRMRILDKAYERVGLGGAAQARWTAFLARAVENPPAAGS